MWLFIFYARIDNEPKTCRTKARAIIYFVNKPHNPKITASVRLFIASVQITKVTYFTSVLTKFTKHTSWPSIFKFRIQSLVRLARAAMQIASDGPRKILPRLFGSGVHGPRPFSDHRLPLSSCTSILNRICGWTNSEIDRISSSGEWIINTAGENASEIV